MTPEERSAKIVNLTQLRLKGERAAAQRQMLEELFQQRQRQYLRALVSRTRIEGQVATDEAWKLVALDDLMTDFDKMVRKGRSAARAIEKLQQQAGVD